MENWELIGKKLCGELTPSESVRFDAWLQRDASNQQLWKEAQEIWASAGTIDSSFDADTETALQKFKLNNLNTSEPSRKKIFTPFRIAASVALLLIPAFFIFKFATKNEVFTAEHKTDSVPPVFAEMKMLTMTTTDSAISFYLPDSTHIYLNKNSSLSYPDNFAGLTREVKLSGEAFFEVAHNAQKPFIIEAGNTETKVTGTSFNIREDTQNKKVVITVLTGQVKFKAKKNADHLSEVTLSPNDRVSYSEQNATMVKQKVKTTDSYWWMKKVRVIRKMLKDVKKELIRPPVKKKTYRDSATKQFQIKNRPL